MGLLYLLMILPLLKSTSNLRREVQHYINKETKNMKKLCKGTTSSYTWKLPIEGSKKLHFILERKNDSFWSLEHVNDILVFQPEDHPGILFNTNSNSKKKELVLERLYPSYPKVTGVDILQFIVTLGFVCNLNVSIFDMSDLTTPYQILFGKRYYKAMIKGIETEFSTLIDKRTFLNCALQEVEQNFHIFQIKIELILNVCIRENILFENCPIGYNWLGKLLHEKIFPICANLIEYYPPIESIFFDWLTFEIFREDVVRILSKKFPKPRQIFYEKRHLLDRVFFFLKSFKMNI
jgi:hypothetical protein